MIKCGNCKTPHATVTGVRNCYAGITFPCTWLVQSSAYDEDGAREIRECGALAWATADGSECEAGHAHVNLETRHAEGWDYATEDEAFGVLYSQLVPAFEPRDMREGKSLVF